MEQYKEGTVFEMYENDDKDYIILKNIKMEGQLYLVVTPISNKNTEYKIDPKGLIILKVDEKSNDIEFVKDSKIIRKIIDTIVSE